MEEADLAPTGQQLSRVRGTTCLGTPSRSAQPGYDPAEEAATGEVVTVCEVSDAVMFELPQTFRAPSEARELVEQHVCPMHGLDALGAAQVVVSELATCAVLYGKPPIVLDLHCGVSELRIAVTHQAESAFARDIPIDEEGGLRTAVLSELSSSWGVDRSPNARTLWTSLPTGASAARRPSAVPTRNEPVGPGSTGSSGSAPFHTTYA